MAYERRAAAISDLSRPLAHTGRDRRPQGILRLSGQPTGRRQTDSRQPRRLETRPPRPTPAAPAVHRPPMAAAHRRVSRRQPRAAEMTGRPGSRRPRSMACGHGAYVSAHSGDDRCRKTWPFPATGDALRAPFPSGQSEAPRYARLRLRACQPALRPPLRGRSPHKWGPSGFRPSEASHGGRCPPVPPCPQAGRLIGESDGRDPSLTTGDQT